MNIDTILLAEISENIRALQLQLDYERAKIITALGGEPAIYNVAGTGKLTSTTAAVGSGSAIAGATLQVDGSIVVGDGSGSAKFLVNQTGGLRLLSSAIKSFFINAGGNVDTGVLINQIGGGGTMLLLASRHTDAGTSTDSALYLVQFFYNGDNTPVKTFIAGDNDFVTLGVSATKTLLLTHPSGYAYYQFLMNKMVV